MKYTRYNLKPKHSRKKNNFLLYLAVTLVLALVLGTVINRVMKNSGILWFDNVKKNIESQEETADKDAGSKAEAETEKKDNNGVSEVETVEIGKQNEFYILQCGAFKVSENAEAAMKKVTGAYIPFMVKEGELCRVFAGIYTKDNADGASEDLKTKGIDTSRVIVDIKTQDLSSVQMAEGVDGLLQITEKLMDGTVKSVKSSDLKGWCSSLDAIDSKMADYNNAEAVKKCIDDLPDEVDKGGAQKILSDVYNIIIQYKK